jgi:hypothetical protein
MSLISRVPRAHGVSEVPGQALELDGAGNLVPSLNVYLEPGQGLELDSFGNLIPTETALTNDDFLELDGSENLTPKSA